MKDRPFIPAWLDDAGLSQSEFRLYCHLCRRADNKTGFAWPQADSIARDCHMARNTVWTSIRSLEAKGFIRRVGKPFGGSNRYQIMVPSIVTKETPVETDTNQRKSKPPIGAKESHQSAQINSREGSPLKVLQGRFSNKEFGPASLPFESDKFRQALDDWQQYHREIKKKLTPISIHEQFKIMKEWGEDRSIAAIKFTIRQGYQGLVEARGHETKEPAPIKVNTGRRTCTIEEA